jgi:hypothetical protein
MLQFLYSHVHSEKTYQKVDEDPVFYFNKREIEIKNRPVFVLFSKLNSL